jgi:hypothetical protein
MRRVLKLLGVGLLFLVVGLCLTIITVPPFLDRIYYRGPASAHFDGERFFNPDGGTRARAPAAASRPRACSASSPDATRRHGRTSVAVTPGYPPDWATPCPPSRGGAVREAWSRCTPL